MKLVVQLKLTPAPVDAAALASTLEACNAAANMVSEVAYTRRAFRNYGLRRLTYGMAREHGLGAQAAQHVVKKVADAYTTLHVNLRNGNLGKPGSKRYEKAAGKPIVFRPQAAQPYDQRNLSLDLDAVSLHMPTGTPPATSPPVRCWCGMRGGSHPPLPPDPSWVGWQDAAGHLTASEKPSCKLGHSRSRPRS